MEDLTESIRKTSPTGNLNIQIKHNNNYLWFVYTDLPSLTEYDLRGSSTLLQLPFPKTENLKKSFCYDGAKLWNSLPADMRDSDTLPTFINAIDAYNL
mgnify:CR=1 FL=1